MAYRSDGFQGTSVRLENLCAYHLRYSSSSDQAWRKAASERHKLVQAAPRHHEPSTLLASQPTLVGGGGWPPAGERVESESHPGSAVFSLQFQDFVR